MPTAPYIPPIDPSNASDTQNFDDTFLDMEPVIKDDDEQTDTDQEGQTDAERTDGEDGAVTPSQSRSPSVHPEEDDVDVFDGYSFKGRHSIIMDDEDEEEDEEEEEEDEESITGPSIDNVLLDGQVSEVPPVAAEVSNLTAMAVVEEAVEPKTPEARPVALPEPVAPPSPTREQAVAAAKKTVPRRSHEVQISETAKAEPSAAEDAKAAKAAAKRQSAQRQRGRREKSGIPALDRDLSDAHDEETEREEDDDWDFVEADVIVEERNGAAKGTSLFARGVVDRYKLAVFRKSTPRRPTGSRTFSGMSTESDLASPEGTSPTPSDKQRRGRSAGLTFRKHPRQFLRQRSPQATSRSSQSTKTLMSSNSATLSATSTTSTGGLLSPSPSGTSTVPGTPSLRSKESAISMGSPSDSSDQSIDEANNITDHTIRGAAVVDEDKQKSKGLKKYKEAGEKVLSIFQSPR